MNKGFRYILVVLVVLSFAVMSIPAFAGADKAGKKSVCANPIGETIEKTPSIKAMQSKPARALSSVFDTLGNKVPTNTDNSGKL